MFLHIEVVKEMQSHLFELIDDGEVENNWLDASPADFERLNNLVQEDLVKPTANLADLVGLTDTLGDLNCSQQYRCTSLSAFETRDTRCSWARVCGG